MAGADKALLWGFIHPNFDVFNEKTKIRSGQYDPWAEI
jgi:hypothetical protein